jgi:outer membrane protein assembly factor BamA
LTLPIPAGAQLIPDFPVYGPDWTDIGFPKLYWTPTIGLGVGVYYAQIKQLGYDDWDDPAPYRAITSLDANLTTSGTRRIELEARMPKLIDGWRFVVNLEARRDSRERYFGIGNDSEFDKANETDDAPYYYRSDNYRYIARGEVQRRIVGGLRVLAGFHMEQWRIDTLAGPSKLALDLASGVDPTIGRSVGDIAGRIGLVFDTRDDEPAPTQGVLIQAVLGLADSSIAGGVTYTRATGSATGYLPLSDKLGLAARIAGQSIVRGNPPLGSLYHFEASDRPFYALGGAETHRAIPQRRLLDADKLFANLDVRYTPLAQPTLYRLTLVGFVDAGRVFPAGEFTLTTDDIVVGGGGGFFLHLFRTLILGTTAAVGPDGVIMNFHTWWPF